MVRAESRPRLALRRTTVRREPTTKEYTMTKAQTFHAIAEALSCDPELVGAVAKELKLTKRADIEAAVRERLSGARDGGADDAAQPTSDEAPKAKAPAKRK